MSRSSAEMNSNSSSRRTSVAGGLSTDLDELRAAANAFSDRWLEQLDQALHDIDKGRMAERHEIVQLKNSLKKAIDENKNLKAKLRAAETSKLYQTAAVVGGAVAAPIISVAEHETCEANNELEPLLVFKTILEEMSRLEECALLIEMFKLAADADDRLKVS